MCAAGAALFWLGVHQFSENETWLVGIALGFAAQKSLGAVIAGLQLSITQPIRLGDVIREAFD